MAIFKATSATRVKNLLDITSSGQDTVLGRLIEATSQRIEQFIDRPLEQKARTEEYTIKPRQSVLFLRAYPLTEQSDIGSVKVATDWDFAAATAVTSTNYHVDLETGMLNFNFFPINNYLGNNMAAAPNAVQVTYTGGLAASEADVPTDYPAIAWACETQVIAMWRRRDDPGRKTTKIGQYGAEFEGPLQFLPDVREALMPYRRQRFGQ
jgi:hypothetical protein